MAFIHPFLMLCVDWYCTAVLQRNGWPANCRMTCPIPIVHVLVRSVTVDFFFYFVQHELRIKNCKKPLPLCEIINRCIPGIVHSHRGHFFLSYSLLWFFFLNAKSFRWQPRTNYLNCTPINTYKANEYCWSVGAQSIVQLHYVYERVMGLYWGHTGAILDHTGLHDMKTEFTHSLSAKLRAAASSIRVCV